jgi:hypothetical protein
MVSACRAVCPGCMSQHWPQPCAATGRRWRSGRQPDRWACHPLWHVRPPQLRNLAGGLAKRLSHLVQGQHAGRGRTALPHFAAHGRLGLQHAQSVTSVHLSVQYARISIHDGYVHRYDGQCAIVCTAFSHGKLHSHLHVHQSCVTVVSSQGGYGRAAHSDRSCLPSRYKGLCRRLSQWVWPSCWPAPLTCSFKEPCRLACGHSLPSRPLQLHSASIATLARALSTPQTMLPPPPLRANSV